MNRALIAASLSAGLVLCTGCASKNYVKNQATPVINKTNELDEMTAKTTNEIRNTDQRAQAGIASVKQAASTADQHAKEANDAAQQAQASAQQALNQATSLQNTVVNLDNYREVSEAQVHFAFNKATLTPKAKTALDQLAANIPNTKGFIVELIGGADRVGSANYNYKLSQERADAVVQYLASKYDVPAYKIFVIGEGKDLAKGTTAKQRAEDRRVEVKLMTNTGADNGTQQVSQAQQPQQR